MLGIKLLILVIPFVAGCASFKSTTYTDTKYTPTNPQQIKVFMYQPPNVNDYINIGEVHAIGARLSNRDNMIERLKEKAAEIGGNALVLNKTENFNGMSGGASYGGNTMLYHDHANFYPEIDGIVLRRK